jgi:prephenate dehydratase
MGLKRVCADVRFLGSYPRADEVAPEARPGTADADFGAAQKWLDGLRS